MKILNGTLLVGVIGLTIIVFAIGIQLDSKVKKLREDLVATQQAVLASKQESDSRAAIMMNNDIWLYRMVSNQIFTTTNHLPSIE